MTIKCLCQSCTNRCSSYAKSELALTNSLTYIYLKNGTKITNNCNLYKTPNAFKDIPLAAAANLGRVSAQIKYL